MSYYIVYDYKVESFWPWKCRSGIGRFVIQMDCELTSAIIKDLEDKKEKECRFTSVLITNIVKL